eukprot:s1949_g4.t1
MATPADGTEFSTDDPEIWNALIVARGSIVEVLLSGTPVTQEEDLWAGFLVLDTRVHSFDASLILEVKSLGCSHPETTKELSSMFNRKRGVLHICRDEACIEDIDNALHVHRLRTFSREGYHRSFMTHYVRSQIKIWLVNAGLEDAAEDTGPPPAGGPDAPALKPEAAFLGRRQKDARSKRPRGGAPDPPISRESGKDIEEKRKELRARLEASRMKMTGQDPGDREDGRPPEVGGEKTRSLEEEGTLVESSDEGYSPSVGPERPALAEKEV